jgi:hypothetical protein
VIGDKMFDKEGWATMERNGLVDYDARLKEQRSMMMRMQYDSFYGLLGEADRFPDKLDGVDVTGIHLSNAKNHLRVCIKYMKFHMEAAERENKLLRKKLNEANNVD